MHYDMRSTYPTLTRIDWLKIERRSVRMWEATNAWVCRGRGRRGRQ